MNYFISRLWLRHGHWPSRHPGFSAEKENREVRGRILGRGPSDRRPARALCRYSAQRTGRQVVCRAEQVEVQRLGGKDDPFCVT